jgi:K+-sensing histidine kinase KdpD
MNDQDYFRRLSHQLGASLSVLHMVLNLENKDAQMTDYALTVLKDMKDTFDRLRQIEALSQPKSVVEKNLRQPLCLTRFIPQLLQATRAPERFIFMSATHAFLPIQSQENLLKIPLYNLLNNALRYGCTHTPIQVTLHQEQTANLFVTRIRITNQLGKYPLPEDKWAFEKYYRAPEVAGIEGSGLGLHLAREACQFLDAELSLFQENDRVIGELIFKQAQDE